MSQNASWQAIVAECFDCEDCKFAASELNSQKIADAISEARLAGADLVDFDKELLSHIWQWSGAQEPAVDPILVYHLMKEATDIAGARWALGVETRS